jgi:hypothetical protein
VSQTPNTGIAVIGIYIETLEQPATVCACTEAITSGKPFRPSTTAIS